MPIHITTLALRAKRELANRTAQPTALDSTIILSFESNGQINRPDQPFERINLEIHFSEYDNIPMQNTK